MIQVRDVGGFLLSRAKSESLLSLCLLFLLVSFAAIAINLERLSADSIAAWVHLLLNSVILFSVLLVIRRNYIARVIFALLISIEVLSRLAYSSEISAGTMISVINAPSGEVLDFVKFNSISTISSIFVLAGFVFFPVPETKARFKYCLLGIALFYLVIPTIVFPPVINEATMERTSISRGISRNTAKLEVIARDVAWRFWPLFSIIGVANATILLGNIETNEFSSWTNVQKTEASPALIIIGIGESLRAKNLGIYGYPRNTTPRLESRKEGLLIYKTAYSAGVNTAVSVAASITKANYGKPDQSRSIVHLANDAGYTTHWYSNQAEADQWDFGASIIAHQSDDYFFNQERKNLREGEEYDAFLLNRLRASLESNVEGERHLYILHFYGSHMSFQDRYPKEFSRFKSSDTLLDEYDNSVYYADYYLNELFSLAEQYNGEIVFFADHGLGDTAGPISLKHDMRRDLDIDSLHVPFIKAPGKPINGVNADSVISLYYFECLFSHWTGITADELSDGGYCEKALSGEGITYTAGDYTLVTVRP